MAWDASKSRGQAPHPATYRPRPLSIGDAHPKLDMATERALLSPVFENQSLPPITPPLAVHVEINFTDPAIRSPYCRSYGSSPTFEPTPRILCGLMRRIERCSEELISRKDSDALDMFKDDSGERKPLRFEMTFRIIRRGSGEWAEMTFRSYQIQPLTVEATREIVLDTHRMVGLFLRRHDRNFLLDDSPASEMDIEDSQTAAPDGPLSLLCVPTSRLNEATQEFDFGSGYNIELVFRSRNPQRKTPLVQKSIRVNSTQAAPLTLSMSEDLLRKGLQVVNHELDTRKKEVDGRFSWRKGARNSCSGAVELDLRISNSLGPAYNHLHRSIQSNVILFRHPEGRDCDDFLSRVEKSLISYRDDTDAKVNHMDDFALNVCEMKGVGWKLRQSLRFPLGPSSSHDRRTIQAALDRIQTGIGDVIHGNNIMVRITAEKRGHLILDKAIVAQETRGQQKERFASPDEEHRTFVWRLKTRIQADINLIFEDSCSIDDIPDGDEEHTGPPTPAQFGQTPSEPSEASSSSPPSLKGSRRFSRGLSDRLHGSPKRFIQKVFSMGRKSSDPAKPPEQSKPSRVRSFLRSNKSTDSVTSIGHVSITGGSETSSKRSSKYGAMTDERPPSLDEAKPSRRSFSIKSIRSIRHRISNESTLVEEASEDAQAKQGDRLYEVKTRESQEFHAQTISKKVTSDTPIPRLLPTPAQNDDRASSSLHEPQKRKMDTPSVYADAREYVVSPMVLTRGNTPSHFDEYSTAPSTPALSSGGSSARNSILITPAFVETQYPVLRDFHVAPGLQEPGIADGPEVVAESEQKASLATERFSVAQADPSGPAKQLEKPALKLDEEPRGSIDPVGQSTAQTPTLGPEVELVEPTKPLPTPEDASNTTSPSDPDARAETSPVGLQALREDVGAEDAAATDCAGHPDFPTREVRNDEPSQEPNGDSYSHVSESEIKFGESAAANVGESAGEHVGVADGSESSSAEDDTVTQSPPLSATEPSEDVAEEVSEQEFRGDGGADGENVDPVADDASESSTLVDVGSVEEFEDASGEQNTVPEAAEELSAAELQEQPEPVAEQHPIVDGDAATALDVSEPESSPQSVILEEVTDGPDLTDAKLASEEQLTAPEADDQKLVEEAARDQDVAAETVLDASEPETSFVPATIDEVVDETGNYNITLGHIEEELATEEGAPVPETVNEKVAEDAVRTQHFDVEAVLSASEPKISPVLTTLEATRHYGDNLAVEEQLVSEQQDPTSGDAGSNLVSEPSLGKEFDGETSLSASEPESLPVPEDVPAAEVIDGSNIKSEHAVVEATADEEPAAEASVTALEVAEEQEVDGSTAMDASEPESLPALDVTPVSEVNDGSEIEIDQSDEDAAADQGLVFEEHVTTPWEEPLPDIQLDLVVSEPESVPAPFELIEDDSTSDLHIQDVSEPAIANWELAPEEQDTATDSQHIATEAFDEEPIGNVFWDEKPDVGAALAASEPESLPIPSENDDNSGTKVMDVTDQELAPEATDAMPAEEVFREYKAEVDTTVSASEPDNLLESSEAPEGVDVPEIETMNVEGEAATTVKTASEEQVVVSEAVDEMALETITLDAEAALGVSEPEPESLSVTASSEGPELVAASTVKTEDVQENDATVPALAAEEIVTASEIVDEKVAEKPKLDVEVASSAPEPQFLSVSALLQEVEIVGVSDNEAENIADKPAPDVEQAPEEQVAIPEIVEEQEQPAEEPIREHELDEETALDASQPQTSSVLIEDLTPDTVANEDLIPEDPTNVSETCEQEPSIEALCDTETPLLVSESESLLVHGTWDTEPIGGSDIEAEYIGSGVVAVAEPVTEQEPIALEVLDEPSQGRLGAEIALDVWEENELVDDSDVTAEDIAADVVAGVEEACEEQPIAPEALEDESLDIEAALNASEPESLELPAYILDSSDKSKGTAAGDILASDEQATVRGAVREETAKDVLQQVEAEETTPAPTEAEIVGGVEATVSEAGDQVPTEEILTQLDTEETLPIPIEAQIVKTSEFSEEMPTQETEEIPALPIADEIVEELVETEIAKHDEVTATETSDEELAEETLTQLEFEEDPATEVEAEDVDTIGKPVPEADDASPAEEFSQDETVTIQTELEAEEIAATPQGDETTEDSRVATPEAVDRKPTEEGFEIETAAVLEQLKSEETAAAAAEARIVNNPAETAPEAVDEIPTRELSEVESAVPAQLDAEEVAPSEIKIDIIDATNLTASEVVDEEPVVEASQNDTAVISAQANDEEILVVSAEEKPAEEVEIASPDVTEDETTKSVHQDHIESVQTQSQAEENAALTPPEIMAENDFGASEVAHEKPANEVSRDEAVAISPQLDAEESVTAPVEAETVENGEAAVPEAVVEQQLAAKFEVQVEEDTKTASPSELPQISHVQEDITVAGAAVDDVNSSDIIEKELVNELEVQASAGLKEEVNEHDYEEAGEEPMETENGLKGQAPEVIIPSQNEEATIAMPEDEITVAVENGGRKEEVTKKQEQQEPVIEKPVVTPAISVKSFTHQLPEDSVTSEVTAVSDQLQTTEASRFVRHHKEREYILNDEGVFRHPNRASTSTFSSTSSWSSDSDAASFMTRDSVDTYRPSFEDDDERPEIEHEPAYFQRHPQTAGLLGLQRDSSRFIEVGLRGALGDIGHLHGHKRRKGSPLNSPGSSRMRVKKQKHRRTVSSSTKKESKPEPHEVGEGEGNTVISKMMLLFSGAVALGKSMTKG